MNDECNHLWALLRSEHREFPYGHSMMSLGMQYEFFCQHDPTHLKMVPPDEEIAYRAKALMEMRTEMSNFS